jgi:hypothetical protein
VVATPSLGMGPDAPFRRPRRFRGTVWADASGVHDVLRQLS